MLSRLAQLCSRHALAQTGSQLLCCLAAASSSAPSSITWWPQQQYHHHQQHHLSFSSSSDAALSPPQQQQQQQQAQPSEAQQAGAQASSSSAAAVQPTQPALQILKVLIDAERPLSSHELHALVQQQYSNFRTRNSFKAYLKFLQRQRYVQTKAPAVSRTGHKKSSKGSDGHWLFVPSHLGLKLDLNAPGKPLQALARKQADEWTQKELPDYVQHLREGRVPVTWQNLGAVQNMKLRQKLYEQHMLAGGAAAAQQQQLQGGDEAAALHGSQQPRKQKK